MMDFSKYNVLMVDDVPLNLLLVEKMLNRFKFRIRKATNGTEALMAVEEEEPDLILLDIMMPVMDGFEVLRRIRCNPKTSHIKVIILSALNSNKDVVHGFELGANDFITKPIVMEKLINCVATQLQLIKNS